MTEATPKHLLDVEWIDQGWQPVAIGFVPSETAWERAVKRYRIDAEYPSDPGRAGHTQWLKNDETGHAMVLVLVNAIAERDAAEVITTLVHEAVHVWQFICQHIGEKAPGIEMEAYAIEAITSGLFKAYTKTQGKGKDWETIHGNG